MIDTPPRLADVPRVASAATRDPSPSAADPGKLASLLNLLWLRINQARAVVQCIQLHQPLSHSDEAALTDALAGAAMDQLSLALADIGQFEACIR
ncbi:MAG: hypothetical protein I8H71_11330 [Xanthomonadaceae bacterium]|nr:hypothetical protein [Xanthomonadaceae bacterium]